MELGNKEELIRFYQDTTYSVYINNEKIDVYIDKALPQSINNLLQNKTAIIFTAWNPRSQLLSINDNMQRNLELLQTLSNTDHMVFEALGQGIDESWPAEMSFMIVGISEADAEKLAVNYGQYAFVWLENANNPCLKFSSVWYDELN